MNESRLGRNGSRVSWRNMGAGGYEEGFEGFSWIDSRGVSGNVRSLRGCPRGAGGEDKEGVGGEMGEGRRGPGGRWRGEGREVEERRTGVGGVVRGGEEAGLVGLVGVWGWRWVGGGVWGLLDMRSRLMNPGDG